jgi:predicted CXXCH cytochrome family protein
MKKAMVLIVVVSFLMVAAGAFAGIANTKHNLMTGIAGSGHTTDGFFVNPGDASDQAVITVCSFCHIPHGGSTSLPDAPLWSRATPTTTYDVYGSGAGGGSAGQTLSGTPVGVPGDLSLTCLSCHDGTISIGTIVKNGVTLSATNFLGASLTATGLIQDDAVATSYNALIGADLRNDHPVGLIFDSTSSLAGLTNTVSGAGTKFFVQVGGIDTFPIFGAGGDGSSRFECASCHDPHTESFVKFLRQDPQTICTDCHSNK